MHFWHKICFSIPRFNSLRHPLASLNIETVEFTTLVLCKVQNLIKTGAFSVFGPKLWPKRWQVPISTGVNFDRRQESQKILPPLNSGPSMFVEFQISSKVKLLQLLLKAIVTIEFSTLQNYGLRDDRYQYWQVPNLIAVENHKKLLLLLNSPPSLCVEYEISKLWPKRGQVPTLTGAKSGKRQKLQKAMVTIEFTALDLCRVQNFIKIEAFAVLHPKLRPERS